MDLKLVLIIIVRRKLSFLLHCVGNLNVIFVYNFVDGDISSLIVFVVVSTYVYWGYKVGFHFNISGVSILGFLKQRVG
jgi:hypothetical protein